MKAIYKILMALAATAMVAGAAPTKDKSALFQPGINTNSTVGIIVEKKSEPKLAVTSHVQASGLLVDCIRPQQTQDLLNPAVPVRNLPVTEAQYQWSAMAPRPISGADAHECNFALLRLSFP